MSKCYGILLVDDEEELLQERLIAVSARKAALTLASLGCSSHHRLRLVNEMWGTIIEKRMGEIHGSPPVYIATALFENFLKDLATPSVFYDNLPARDMDLILEKGGTDYLLQVEGEMFSHKGKIGLPVIYMSKQEALKAAQQLSSMRQKSVEIRHHNTGIEVGKVVFDNED